MSALFADASPALVQTVAAASHPRQVEDGEVLCHQGDIAHTVWLVLSGWIKCTRETLEGHEAVWDVLGMGHLAGLEALNPPYAYTTRAVAVGPGTVLTIPHNILRQALEKNQAFAMQLVQYTASQQHDRYLEIEHRSHQTAPQRIGCFLLKLAGTPAQGTITLDLPFDKGLLAARLGMQPETFSRALAKLKQETGMTANGVHFVMDAARMAAYTCGACSGVYPCR